MNGTITKRSTGNGNSWGYSFFAGRDESGKRLQITKSGFDTKRQADAALRDAIAAHQAGRGVLRPTPKTLDQFLEEWFAEHAPRKCTPKTLERYRQLAGYLTPHLGAKPISELTALHLERVYNLLHDKGGKNGAPLSAKTVHHIAGVIHSALEKAVRLKLIAANPAKDCELPRVETEEAAIVEQTQLDFWIEAAKPHYPMATLLAIAAATGCRRGELLALTWPDFNPVLKVLRISKSLEQTREGLRLKKPKGRRPRTVRLPASAVEKLEELRTEQAHMRQQFGADYRRDLDLIFAAPDGEYLKPDSVTAKACLLAQRAGLKGISLHSLRHTHGSQLLSLGVSLPVVSKRLGHCNTSITAEVYAHALEWDEIEAAELWDRAALQRRIPSPEQ